MLFHRIPASAVCSRFKLCCPPCQLRRRLSLDGEGADAGARGPVLCDRPLTAPGSTTDLDKQNSTASTFSVAPTPKLGLCQGMPWLWLPGKAAACCPGQA